MLQPVGPRFDPPPAVSHIIGVASSRGPMRWSSSEGSSMDDEKKPRTVRDVLIAARERIAKPGGWTQRTYARDAAGEPVAPRNRDAACYCAVGAINAAGGGHEACRALRMATGNGGYL